MKNSKYTGGKWKSTLISSIKKKEYFIENITDGKLIARIHSEEVTDEEVEANAKLISSSPDLLEALIKVKGWLTVFEEIAPEIHAKYGNIDVEIGIEKAINKATK